MIMIMFGDLEPYLADMRTRRLALAPAEALFSVDDPIRLLHFVTEGEIHLLRHQPGGAPLILQRAGPGAILAEASLYSERYHCDARAVGKAATLAVAKGEMLGRLEADSRFSYLWARRLAIEVQRARSQSEILAMRTVAARLDAWLALRGGLPAKGEWIRLAAEIGVSPEALYREIAKRSS